MHEPFSAAVTQLPELNAMRLPFARARELAGGPSYIQANVRDYQPDICAYDLAIVMSQSFGHFDAATNRDLLRQLAMDVREGGRVVLHLWSPEFFATHQGERDFELPDGIVRERKRVEDGRLFVHLDYPDSGHDDFEWQLFNSSEMTSLADSVGLALIVSCTDFDMAVVPLNPAYNSFWSAAVYDAGKNHAMLLRMLSEWTADHQCSLATQPP